MAHRTLNTETKFYGDGRETAPVTRNWPGKKKIDGAMAAWAEQFPTYPWPKYRGSAYDAYEKLEAAGWTFSSRYGWRKTEAA